MHTTIVLYTAYVYTTYRGYILLIFMNHKMYYI